MNIKYLDVYQDIFFQNFEHFKICSFVMAASTPVIQSGFPLSPVVICILLYDQSYSCNTLLSPHAYVLVTESFSFTISSENWKTVTTAAVLFSLLELNHCHHCFFVDFIDIEV
jgi:hypothetical protein